LGPIGRGDFWAWGRRAGEFVEHIRFCFRTPISCLRSPNSRRFGSKLLATAVEIPPIEVISQPTPNRKTPTSGKGMSEGGIMGATGVLPSAVNDALRRSAS
jgi:hypothetical protein